MKHWVVVIFLILLLAVDARAGEGSWDVLLASRELLAGVSLVGIRGDSLNVTGAFESRWVPLDSVRQLTRVNDSRFREGAALGVVTGGLIGGLLGHEDVGYPYHDEGIAFGIILGGAAGFALGGAIGTMLGIDDVYDVWNLDRAQKRKTILAFLSP